MFFISSLCFGKKFETPNFIGQRFKTCYFPPILNYKGNSKKKLIGTLIEHDLTTTFSSRKYKTRNHEIHYTNIKLLCDKNNTVPLRF